MRHQHYCSFACQPKVPSQILLLHSPTKDTITTTTPASASQRRPVIHHLSTIDWLASTLYWYKLCITAYRIRPAPTYKLLLPMTYRQPTTSPQINCSFTSQWRHQLLLFLCQPTATDAATTTAPSHVSQRRHNHSFVPPSTKITTTNTAPFSASQKRHHQYFSLFFQPTAPPK